MGIASAFFRFYFDSNEPAARRASSARPSGSRWRWRRSGSSSARASRRRSPTLLFGITERLRSSSRAAFVGLWAGMNYEQLTSLFRVEERSVAFVSASLANILAHDRRDAAARRRARQGADRRHRRQLHRNARRLRRARRLPPRAARSRVRPGAAARDEPLRAAARADRALPVGDELLATASSS